MLLNTSTRTTQFRFKEVEDATARRLTDLKAESPAAGELSANTSCRAVYMESSEGLAESPTTKVKVGSCAKR